MQRIIFFGRMSLKSGKFHTNLFVRFCSSQIDHDNMILKVITYELLCRLDWFMNLISYSRFSRATVIVIDGT